MTEKNVVGMRNKGDDFSAHKFGEGFGDDDKVQPIDYSTTGPTRVAPVSGGASVMDPISQWRTFSEALKMRRERKEAIERGEVDTAPPKPQNQVSQPPRVTQAQKDKSFQSRYESDSIDLGDAPDPMYASFQRYLAKVNYPVPDEADKTYFPPLEEHEPCPEGSLRVGDVMTKKVVCVIESTPVEEFASICNRRGISGAPVVHYSTRRLLGEVAISDIVEHIFDSKSLSTFSAHGEVLEQQSLGILDEPVHDFMRKDVVTVTPECSVQEACQLMTQHNLQRIIVVKGDLVRGIFSARDAVRILAETPHLQRPEPTAEKPSLA